MGEEKPVAFQVSRGLGLQARIEARRRRQRVAHLALALFVLMLVVSTSVLGWRTHSLTAERKVLRVQVGVLQQQLRDGGAREADLTKKLNTAQTQLDQLSTDATGKDAVIKGLQNETTTKQAQIDALTAERTSLKGCLDGVTLALVQLTNDGSAAAKTTIDGVRDVCKQAEVLL